MIVKANAGKQPMEMLLGLAVMASVPAYFVIQPISLAQWDGGWRKAALAPL